jgi:hypothetical protein
MKIVNGKDFWAGIMFLAVGFIFASIAYNNYPMGTAVRMGPAYFPVWLGCLMMVLGAIVFIRGFVSKIPHPLKVFVVRPKPLVGSLVLMVPLYFWTTWFMGVPDITRWLLAALTLILFLSSWGPPALFICLVSVAAFGYLLRPFGLIIAVIVLVWGSFFASHEYNHKEAAILAVGIAAFAAGVFIYGLGLSLAFWPDWS